MDDEHDIDEILGITRCVRCGHRLEGDIECPLCSMLDDPLAKRREPLPKWVVMSAAFLTSPLSLPWVVMSRRLRLHEKIIAASGAVCWALGFSFWM